MNLSLAPSRAAPPKAPMLQSERRQDAPLVTDLIDRAFGPGRYAKAAERLRERNTPLMAISFCAWSEGRLVGCVRMWPILIGEQPAVFLGPFAVEPEFRSLGLGATLIRRAVAATAEAGHAMILLVGDAPYFEPLGFRKVPAGRITLPGPVDANRVFRLALVPGGDDDLAGAVTVP